MTGVGAVTNLGHDTLSTWDAMVRGASGVGPIEGEEFNPWLEDWEVKIAGQVRGFDPASRLDPREARRLDRVAHLGLPAAIEAVEMAGLDFSKENPTRCGVVIGSGIGGLRTIEEGAEVLRRKGPKRVNPFTVPKLMVNSCAGHVSIRFGLEGYSSAHATACASAGHSIIDAVSTIRRDEADVMLAGGAEGAISPICLAAFMTMKALSTRNDEPEKASRPFDRDRDGFVLAEGAGILTLEEEQHARARGAEILCEVLGVAATSDAAHITAPAEGGEGAVRSMRMALQDAGIAPDAVDYINAHGTSTPLGDAAEVAAVRKVFGDHALPDRGGRLMMSSTKSMHGHALGASGGVEMVACVGAIRHGVAPPTINLDQPDEGFDLDFVANAAKERPIRVAMNNTFGFGGHNVTIVLGRYDG